MEVKGGKFLTFTLGKEDYGLPIASVKEINGLMHITAMPKTPVYVKGVINLRGKIIPVMDLRQRFGLPELPYTERTCFIVVELSGEVGGIRQWALVVDAVSEVLTVQTTEIEPPPSCGQSTEDAYLCGVAKTRGKVILLLAVEKVLDTSIICLPSTVA